MFMLLFTSFLNVVLFYLAFQSLFSKLPPAVIFKYVPIADPDHQKADDANEEAYCDNLNSWVSQLIIYSLV